MIIIIYTKSNFVQCDTTKPALDRRGIAYQIINLDIQPEATGELRTLGSRQVPARVASLSSTDAHPPTY
ncbi:glutaredoxin domain-containing protein, partial [Pantoea sp. SIMBA_079]|uniref:glutaredoxin domain-containing protein n=1 Tax=Pantoea sp. SIMBA_079 TaxID=3085817 RepID=UPI003993DF84